MNATDYDVLLLQKAETEKKLEELVKVMKESAWGQSLSWHEKIMSTIKLQTYRDVRGKLYKMKSLEEMKNYIDKIGFVEVKTMEFKDVKMKDRTLTATRLKYTYRDRDHDQNVLFLTSDFSFPPVYVYNYSLAEEFCATKVFQEFDFPGCLERNIIPEWALAGCLLWIDSQLVDRNCVAQKILLDDVEKIIKEKIHLLGLNINK